MVKSVSVVVTTFKNPERLRSALVTVKQQTFSDYEILVVDGANSKECKDMALFFGARFVGLKEDLPPPNGVQRSRNVGIENSRGEYIAFLDDDDEWRPDKLERQYKEITGPAVGLVSCFTRVVNKKGKSFKDKKMYHPNLDDLLRNFEISATSSLMVRKEAILKAGGWAEDIRGMHEYDVALRIAREGYKVVCVQKDLLIKHQDIEVQLGSIYWKIAEMYDFIKLYRKDILRLLGWSGAVFNVAKMWFSIAVYANTIIFKDRIWRILYIFRVGMGKLNDKDKRESETNTQDICD